MPTTWLSLALALAAPRRVNPRLALDLLRTGLGVPAPRLVARSAPFLPLPDRAYLRWRMYTAYGDEPRSRRSRTSIGFARWRRETMRL